MALDLENPSDFRELATVVKGFSSDTRLALLLGFRHGYTVQEIADFLEMTRGGLQNNIYKMIDADLVYRPPVDEKAVYELTPLGLLFARQFNAYGKAILEARSLLATTEDDLSREIAESPLADGLSETEVAKLIHTKKWTNAGTEVATLLTEAKRGSKPYTRPKHPPKDITQIIVDRVAQQEGVDPMALERPLNDVINLEVLEHLFTQNSQPSDKVQFAYLDYTITVTAAGEVDVSNGSDKDISTES